MVNADGRFAVHIDGVATPVLCRPDEPILDAALAQGVALPHNCRGGACGTCRATLLAGETSEGWIQSFVLTDEEREEGKILPCVARPQSDCHIRLDAALATAVVAARRIGATVVACEAVAPAVRRLVLEPDAVLPWRAGGQVRLVLPGIFPDRIYSIASPVAADDHLRDNQIELFIAIRPGGLAGRVVEGLEPGWRVELDGPHGTLAMPDGAGRIVLVAGGTGLSPLLSLARQALARGEIRPMLLLFSVPGPRDLFALDALKALTAHANFSYRLCLTRVSSSGFADAHYGRVTGILGRLVGPGTAVLAAGSAQFGADVRAVARDHGVDPAAIRVDSFLPA